MTGRTKMEAASSESRHRLAGFHASDIGSDSANDMRKADNGGKKIKDNIHFLPQVAPSFI